jgi:single-strand DNA-binding protein
LAVDRRPTQSGQRDTDFIDIVVFGRLAEITCKYMDKGRQVAVEGRLQTRTYETKDGQKRKAWEVYGENVQFLGPKPRTRSDDSVDNSVPEDPGDVENFTE